MNDLTNDLKTTTVQEHVFGDAILSETMRGKRISERCDALHLCMESQQ